jgi:hypothetical protein
MQKEGGKKEQMENVKTYRKQEEKQDLQTRDKTLKRK